MWAQLGSNQRPPDYESGAANHLSYGPEKSDCNINQFDIILQEPGKKIERHLFYAANYFNKQL